MSAPALVESQADPRTPGRTAYRVTSLYSPEAVQRAVAEIMDGDGVRCAEFTQVRRGRSGADLNFDHYFALGYTMGDAHA